MAWTTCYTSYFDLGGSSTNSSISFNEIFDMEVPPRFESVGGKVHELKKALNELNETVPKKTSGNINVLISLA